MPNEPIAYGIDPEDLRKLRAMSARLCGGTDRERDEGNLLHLLVGNIEDCPIYNLADPQ